MSRRLLADPVMRRRPRYTLPDPYFSRLPASRTSASSRPLRTTLQSQYPQLRPFLLSSLLPHVSPSPPGSRSLRTSRTCPSSRVSRQRRVTLSPTSRTLGQRASSRGSVGARESPDHRGVAALSRTSVLRDRCRYSIPYFAYLPYFAHLLYFAYLLYFAVYLLFA